MLRLGHLRTLSIDYSDELCHEPVLFIEKLGVAERILAMHVPAGHSGRLSADKATCLPWCKGYHGTAAVLRIRESLPEESLIRPTLLRSTCILEESPLLNWVESVTSV